jgi:hypothetical protein
MSQQQQSQPASELPVDNTVETGQQRYPVDDITQRTPCALQSKRLATVLLRQTNQETSTMDNQFLLDTLK